MMVTVCHRCTERHLGCHGTCPKYLEQKAEGDKIRAEKWKEALVTAAIMDSVVRSADGAKRKR